MRDSMNISEWVRKWSQIQPDKIAICFEDREISYFNLNRQVRLIAAFFEQQGFTTGQRIAVLMDNCPEFIQIYLACAKRGLVMVPFNVRWAEAEVDWVIGNCEPAAIFFHHKYKRKITGRPGGALRHKIVKVEIPEDKADYLERFVQQSVGDEEMARTMYIRSPAESPHVIMFTSGTTGRPKGAILSMRKTFFNSLNAHLFLELCGDDRMLLNVPLFHSGGLFIQATPILYRGACLVIHSKFNASATYRDIRKYRITKYSAVPTIMKKLLAAPQRVDADLSSLKICAVGAEKVTDDLVRQCLAAGFPLYQIMGQTETSIMLWASSKELVAFPNTLGKPVFHGQVELFDATGNPAKAGEIGELAIKGPTLMSGYWRLPEESEKKIRDGWLYTGDMAWKNESGYYFMVDRFTDMYISGGENVYPAEVERVLKQMDAISDVAVVGIPDPDWGQTGHAFVIKKKQAALTDEDIRTYCKRRLARFKWPSKITFCEDFPRTALGKIIKKKVRANCRTSSVETLH